MVSKDRQARDARDYGFERVPAGAGPKTLAGAVEGRGRHDCILPGGRGGVRRDCGARGFWFLHFIWLLSAASLAAQPAPQWQWSHPIPHGNNIADLAFQDGLYVQVTDHGGIYTSTNRVVWDRRESSTSRELRGAAFLGNRLLITGEAGTALWSDDALRFEPATLSPSTTDWLEGVAASSERAVAVGDNGAIYQTTNGEQWSRVTSLGAAPWLSGVAYGAGTFVAVGETGFIASSTDGLTWTPRASGTSLDLTRVAYGTNLFIAVGLEGVILISTNGIDWQMDPAPNVDNDLLTAAAAPVGRLAGGESELLLRRPPGPWESQVTTNDDASLAPDWTFLASVWDGSRFVVSGRTGVSIESLHTNLLSAPNLTLWFRLDDSPRNWLWDVRRIGTTYLAVGDRATILTSPSGSDWSIESSTATPETTLYGLAGSTNVAVAVGSGGAILRSESWFTNLVVTNVIIVDGSTNHIVRTNQVDLLGVLWSVVDPPPTTNTLQGIEWHDGQFVAVGAAGTVLRSGDGIEWTVGSIPSTSFFSTVARGPSGWVAGGTDGSLFTSTDATSWRPLASGTTNWIYRIRALEGGMVALGQNGLLLTSEDGLQWTPRDSGTRSWLTDLRKVGESYFVCGLQGTILRSLDLETWEVLPIPTGKALYGLASQDGQLITAGAEGIILRAVADSDAAPVGLNVFRHYPNESPPVDLFLFEGTPELRFRLESAMSLGQWQTEAELQLNASGSVTYGRVASGESRFYRTVTRD